jgi:hypothetical protein
MRMNTSPVPRFQLRQCWWFWYAILDCATNQTIAVCWGWINANSIQTILNMWAEGKLVAVPHPDTGRPILVPEEQDKTGGMQDAV